jgi:succinate-semialdehyde dehydrogenase/glutarate-semialdehyde dehydrogenase
MFDTLENQIVVTNPVTGAAIGAITPASQDDVQAAVERARAAQPGWFALGLRERIRLLRCWGDMLWSDQERLLEIICAETGKPRVGAYNEIAVNDHVLTYYAYHAPRILRPEHHRGYIPFFQRAQVHYKPHGVVGLITPWNYPLFLAFVDLIPALLGGNTVVLKPSEITPFSAHYGVERLREAGVPADVVQIVDGAGDVGAALVDVVDYIGFTGSTAVGRRVATRAAERLIPFSLELGGKDPAIVLNDADLDTAVNGVLVGGLENAGQMCTSTERVYVEAGIYERFLEGSQHRAQDLVLGSGWDAHLGSLTNEREVLRAEQQIADAVQKGARVIVGGHRRADLGPLYFEPTLLADADHSMLVMQEETFGPLIALMRVNSVDEALRLANDNAYGLSGVIYTRDVRQGAQIARRIDSGDVSINRPSLIWGASAAPMGGQKASGLGRRGGPDGLRRFVSSQTIVTDHTPASLLPPALMHFTPRVRVLVSLRRKLLRFLPFLRP